MTPLARSLLALAALLAAADAIMPKCIRLPLGEKSDDAIKFALPLQPQAYNEGGQIVRIPDKCSRPGRQIGGQDVEVCSSKGKIKILPPLQDEHVYPINYSMVLVECLGCDDGTKVLVTQYCKMVVPPK